MLRMLFFALLIPLALPAEEIDVTKLSEAFGHMIGKNLDGPGFSFDLEAIISGMRKAAAGEPSPMSDEEYDRALTIIQERTFNNLADKNLQEANSFLKENGSKPGVMQIEKGKIQYVIQQAGDGPAVAAGDTPLIHYKGSYLDGTVFGSSQEGEPVTLPLGQTIPGFSKGMTGMKVGEKRKLYIHPELGYGLSGQLAPNALLVFEVEVVKLDEDHSS